MFYGTEENRHGLPHDPFKALVSPRPIGWIGTRGRDGSINLAPYSFFNAVSDRPKLVMFSSSGWKHSVRNAEETGEFTASLASRHLAERVNASSIDAPYGSERVRFERSHRGAGTARRCAVRGRSLCCTGMQGYADRPARRHRRSAVGKLRRVRPGHRHPYRSGIIVDGRIDMATAAPLARLGYRDYSDGSAGLRDGPAEMARMSLPAMRRAGIRPRAASMRSAWRRCGLSIIRPSSESTPASGPASRRVSMTRRA